MHCLVLSTIVLMLCIDNLFSFSLNALHHPTVPSTGGGCAGSTTSNRQYGAPRLHHVVVGTSRIARCGCSSLPNNCHYRLRRPETFGELKSEIHMCNPSDDNNVISEKGPPIKEKMQKIKPYLSFTAGASAISNDSTTKKGDSIEAMTGTGTSEIETIRKDIGNLKTKFKILETKVGTFEDMMWEVQTESLESSLETTSTEDDETMIGYLIQWINNNSPHSFILCAMLGWMMGAFYADIYLIKIINEALSSASSSP